jgi:catechol 2,3-dioxygenase-like lactoylglutathione lyase family enzyme
VTEVRLDHVSVTCGDVEASIAFYRDVIGLPLIDRGRIEGDDLGTLIGHPGASALWAELALGGGQILELLQYVEPAEEALEPRPVRPGATHIGLAFEQLEPVLARVRDAGVEVSETVILDEPGWEGVRCAYASDPDGVSIELVQRPRERVVVLPETESATDAAVPPADDDGSRAKRAGSSGP